jgi:hypothetical protein
MELLIAPSASSVLVSFFLRLAQVRPHITDMQFSCVFKKKKMMHLK